MARRESGCLNSILLFFVALFVIGLLAKVAYILGVIVLVCILIGWIVTKAVK